MSDREKVIKGLECCMLSSWEPCHDCPYYCGDVTKCAPKVKSDAIALLKAQKPVYVEERLVLDKLHNIQDYARVNQINWIADGAAFAETVMNMLRGEINLLRNQQEPRVMTEQELDQLIASLDGEARVWIEHRKLGVYCATLWRGNPNRGCGDFYNPRYECYHAREAIWEWWRPWTSRPTDDQREATPWNTN